MHQNFLRNYFLFAYFFFLSKKFVVPAPLFGARTDLRAQEHSIHKTFLRNSPPHKGYKSLCLLFLFVKKIRSPCAVVWCKDGSSGTRANHTQKLPANIFSLCLLSLFSKEKVSYSSQLCQTLVTSSFSSNISRSFSMFLMASSSSRVT